MTSLIPQTGAQKALHDIFRSEICGLRKNPRLLPAMRIYVRDYLDLYRGHPEKAKYLGGASGFLLEAALLYYHLIFVHQGVGAGATRLTLQSAAIQREFSSIRKVSYDLDRLVKRGRVSFEIDKNDARIRRFVPSGPLVEDQLGQLKVYAAAAEVLWPNLGISNRLCREDDYFHRLRIELSRIEFGGAEPLSPFPELWRLLKKDAGGPLAAALVQVALQNDKRLVQNRVHSVNIMRLSDQFGVSRGHVRGFLEYAESDGLLQLSPSGANQVRLTNKFVSSVVDHFCCMMILTTAAAKRQEAVAGPGADVDQIAKLSRSWPTEPLSVNRSKTIKSPPRSHNTLGS